MKPLILKALKPQNTQKSAARRTARYFRNHKILKILKKSTANVGFNHGTHGAYRKRNREFDELTRMHCMWGAATPRFTVSFAALT